jgi:hypothetical protein
MSSATPVTTSAIVSDNGSSNRLASTRYSPTANHVNIGMRADAGPSATTAERCSPSASRAVAKLAATVAHAITPGAGRARRRPITPRTTHPASGQTSIQVASAMRPAVS